MSQIESGGARTFMPTAMLDAGDTPWSALSETVEQRMAYLPVSGVLEITSVNPTIRSDVLEWCRMAGHTLIEMSADGARTWFWIKKQ